MGAIVADLFTVGALADFAGHRSGMFAGCFLTIIALNAIFGILFYLNALWTADRYGRRWLFMVGAVGMGLCMMIVATVSLTTLTAANGTKSQTVGIGMCSQMQNVSHNLLKKERENLLTPL